MSACSGTVLPLSFTEKIRTLEGVSAVENANVKRLTYKQICNDVATTTDVTWKCDMKFATFSYKFSFILASRLVLLAVV